MFLEDDSDESPGGGDESAERGAIHALSLSRQALAVTWLRSQRSRSNRAAHGLVFERIGR